MIDFLADLWRHIFLGGIGLVAISALLLEWAMLRWERAQ